MLRAGASPIGCAMETNATKRVLPGNRTMFRIYLWIDGSNFDPDLFQTTTGAELGGQVVTTKRMREGSVEAGPKYWKSSEIQVDTRDPEDRLFKLLSRIKSDLDEVKKEVGVRLVAEIVEYVDDLDSLQGFFFSSELVQLLAEMGLGLDIDIVRRLSNGQKK
jgi:hypothetical protein